MRIFLVLCFVATIFSSEVICKGIVLVKELMELEDTIESLYESEREVSFASLESVMEERGADEELAPVRILIDLPGSGEELVEILQEQFINQQIDEEMTKDLQKAIYRFYEKHQRPFTVVAIPPQEIKNQQLQVCVRESEIDCLQISGASHTSREKLIEYLDIDCQAPINMLQLRKGLDFINRNPFRRASVVYSPGTKAYTTQLDLKVDDRTPFRLYAGSENSGINWTGTNRFFSGFNVAIPKIDHFFSFQFTGGYDLAEFKAYTAQYIMYLPWKHEIALSGGYSSLRATLSFPGSNNHGQSYAANGVYNIPLNPSKWFSHECGFGVDFKRTNNTIEFSETYPIFGDNVDLTQGLFRYSFSYERPEYQIDFNSKLFGTGGYFNSSSAAFQTLRPGASNRWLYGRICLKYLKKFSSCNINLMARAQLSTTALLPSEQLGMGGFDTVRGYEERQLNFDNGAILNGELLSPAYSFFKKKDALQVLGFIDYGYGGNNVKLPGEKRRDHLLGIGPGIRYTFNSWFVGRLDYGVKMHREEEFGGGSGMWYFSVIGSI
jgi:hemolysin activation/secretion protein